MSEPRFRPQTVPLDLAALAALTNARAADAAAGRRLAITGVGTLDWAGPFDLAMYDPDEPEARAKLEITDAGACLVPASVADFVPAGAVALVTEDPRRAFLAVAAALFPDLARPVAMFGPGVAAGAVVHPDARLEPDVSLDPGAAVGPGAEIGRGAVIGANAVIGAGSRIGRDSAIGAGAVVTRALIGDRVLIQQGASIGHAGTVGRAATTDGGSPSFGRVIVQDDAEIGANAAVACGRRRDTVIGEATRVDALARIAADVVIGRRCLVYADVAIAEAANVPDNSICGLGASKRHPSPEDLKA